MAKTFMIMAGGTGGHVFPALATAKKLQQAGDKVVWLGARGGFEDGVVQGNNIEFNGLSISGLRGKGALTLVQAPIKLVIALSQALKLVRANKPACVIGMGGFASGPGGVAAKLSGVPLFIHEQNAVAGLTNRILARFATRVFEAFPKSFGVQQAATLIGNPLREDIVRLFDESNRFDAESLIEGTRKPRLLVLGGSLGALKLNEVIPSAIAHLEHADQPEVRHQAGRGKAESAQSLYLNKGVDAEVSEFIDDMAEAYRWADIVICRAGALTVSELCMAGLGAILVPYPFAVDDHQTLNAQSMVDANAAYMMPQENFNEKTLVDLIKPLLNNPKTIVELGEAAKRIATPDAAEQLATACREVAYA